jgi:hypothetical protein
MRFFQTRVQLKSTFQQQSTSITNKISTKFSNRRQHRQCALLTLVIVGGKNRGRLVFLRMCTDIWSSQCRLLPGRVLSKLIEFVTTYLFEFEFEFAWNTGRVHGSASWTDWDEQKLISLFKQCCNNGHAKVNLCISKSGYSHFPICCQFCRESLVSAERQTLGPLVLKSLTCVILKSRSN